MRREKDEYYLFLFDKEISSNYFCFDVMDHEVDRTVINASDQRSHRILETVPNNKIEKQNFSCEIK